MLQDKSRNTFLLCFQFIMCLLDTPWFITKTVLDSCLIRHCSADLHLFGLHYATTAI